MFEDVIDGISLTFIVTFRGAYVLSCLNSAFDDGVGEFALDII